LDNRLLFSTCELKAVKGSINAERYSFYIEIKDPAFNIKGLSSSLVALELARLIGLEGKLKSPFIFK
jgi:hypothetical protein